MPRNYKNIPQSERKKGEYYEYKRERERIDKKLQYYSDKFDKEMEKVRLEFAEIARKAFFDVFNSAIEEWYDAYDPNVYDRKHSLYQIPYFEIDASDPDDIVARFGDDDPHRITRYHRVSDEYIYINSYLRGWHGGADMLGSDPAPGYEEPHPRPRTGAFGIGNETGVPYWRWPTKPKNGFIRWQIWYPTPAVRTESPDLIANRNWPPVAKQIEEEYEKREEEVFRKYYKMYIDYRDKYKRW